MQRRAIIRPAATFFQRKKAWASPFFLGIKKTSFERKEVEDALFLISKEHFGHAGAAVSGVGFVEFFDEVQSAEVLVDAFS